MKRRIKNSPDADFMALAARYEEANRLSIQIADEQDEARIAADKLQAELERKWEEQNVEAERLYRLLLSMPATTFEALIYKLKLANDYDGIGSVTGDDGGLEQYSNGWGTDALVSAMRDAERVFPHKGRE